VYQKGAITVVLPRAPVIRARKLHHLQSMKQWIEAVGVKEVLLLAGVDAASRVDEGLRA
jgi:predicted ATP-grasp superfamily ATP-dependent carboligase